MKTSKRLLSVAMSAVLLFGSAFSALADDAVTTVQYISGTVTASNVSADDGATEVTVPVEIKFEGQQVSPHGMFDITANGATLKSATLTDFDNANYVDDPAITEDDVDKSVYVDADGVNTANGRIVVESATDDSKQPATTYVKLDVVLEFATELTAGQVIDVVISNIQATNLSEYGWDGMSAVNGKITVAADVTHEAATEWTYDETNHWHACVVDGCTEHTYDVAAHTLGDYVASEDGTTETATCSANCGYTHTQDVEEKDTPETFVNDVTVSNLVDTQEIRATFIYTAAETKELATYINDLGGVVTAFGVGITWDGTDPKTSETGANAVQEINATYWNYILNYGLALDNVVYSYYAGMNLTQMATTNVRCITYYTYALNSETITVYSAEKSQILMDYLRTQSDEKSTAVVSAYELMQAADSADVSASSVILDGTYGPTFTAYYDLKNITAKGSISYTAAQTKALANYINDIDGTITALNLAFTWDGTDPMTSTTALVGTQDINSSYWNYMCNYGLALPDILNGYFTGMNFAQFDDSVSFVAYVTYTDANGDSQKYYLGETQSIRFVELIEADTSELGVAYKDLYSKFVG